MSKSTVGVICKYEDYYFSREGTYLRMYGGSRAPSLIPKYAMDYIVQKEAVRQIFIDGVRNFLFDKKKEFFPPLPFSIGNYKFTRVKNASEFVKDLENFYFGEKSFHINDLFEKVANHCASLGVYFEYSHHFDKDEVTYKNSCNMTSLSNRLKKKISTSGDKGSSSTIEQQKQQEEAARKQE